MYSAFITNKQTKQKTNKTNKTKKLKKITNKHMSAAQTGTMGRHIEKRQNMVPERVLTLSIVL